MLYKYQSIKYIAEDLYRDYGFNVSIEFDDVVEWCGKALNLIGAPQQYEYTIARMCVEDYFHYLPCNFVKPLQVYYNGYPLKESTGFYPDQTSITNFISEPLTDKPVSQGLTGADQILQDMEDAGYDIPTEVENIIRGTFPLANVTYTGGDYYQIQDNKIYTSFESGCILFIYKGIKVDDEGYPMIPDNAYYEKACSAYVIYMTDRLRWRAGRLPDKVYAESKSDWNKYVRAARASAQLPSVDRLESMKNQWVRLIPNTNAHSTFFSNLNIKENIKRH